ncbi:hypothetical protein VTO42DRAFT_7494 [Malbranchea cinnamomea]
MVKWAKGSLLSPTNVRKTGLLGSELGRSLVHREESPTQERKSRVYIRRRTTKNALPKRRPLTERISGALLSFGSKFSYRIGSSLKHFGTWITSIVETCTDFRVLATLQLFEVLIFSQTGDNRYG